MTNELTTPQEKPAFLTSREDRMGVDALKQYQRPSFTKIVQAMAKPPLKPPFNDGDLIIMPDLVRVLEEGTVGHVVPIFFYPEFCIHNPLNTQPFIAEKSFNPESEIAIKARSRSTDERTGELDGKIVQYVEHLNFVLVFLDNAEIGMKPIVHSFYKGEWKYGANFASLIDSRGTDIFGCRFEVSVGDHTSPQYSWKGLNVTNPKDGNMWVQDEELYNKFKAMHLDVKRVFESGQIDMDYETETASSDTL